MTFYNFLFQAIATTLLLAGCQKEGVQRSSEENTTERGLPTIPRNTDNLVSIQFRPVVEQGDTNASEYKTTDETLYLGKLSYFRAHIHPIFDGSRHPAIGFAISDEDRELFRQYATSLLGFRVAILCDGRVLSIPAVVGPMSGIGLIQQAPTEFTLEEVDQLIASWPRVSRQPESESE